MKSIKIGDRVKRKACDYLFDEVGNVVDLNIDTGRARVKWPTKRTWVAFNSLVILSDNYKP